MDERQIAYHLNHRPADLLRERDQLRLADQAQQAAATDHDRLTVTTPRRARPTFGLLRLVTIFRLAVNNL